MIEKSKKPVPLLLYVVLAMLQHAVLPAGPSLLLHASFLDAQHLLPSWVAAGSYDRTHNVARHCDAPHL